MALVLGLNVSILSKRSQAKELALGNKFFKGYLVLQGKDLINSKAFSLVMYEISVDLGVPKTDMILWIWSK